MDRGAWRATVHRVTKSRTQLQRLSILDYDTIHHFPSAEFQRVMVESLSLALGPQQRIERR